MLSNSASIDAPRPAPAGSPPTNHSAAKENMKLNQKSVDSLFADFSSVAPCLRGSSLGKTSVKLSKSWSKLVKPKIDIVFCHLAALRLCAFAFSPEIRVRFNRIRPSSTKFDHKNLRGYLGLFWPIRGYFGVKKYSRLFASIFCLIGIEGDGPFQRQIPIYGPKNPLTPTLKLVP